MIATDSAGRITRFGELTLEWPDCPVMPAPTAEVLRTRTYEQAVEAITRRQEALRAMREDPYRHGWEPKIWQLADALIEWPWANEIEKERGRRVRANLGFDRPVRTLLLSGGNASGKTDYAAKRLNRFMVEWAKASVGAWHSTSKMSVAEMQPRVYHYLPAEYKEEVKGKVHYMKYTQHGGFSDDNFILPNASRMEFRNYSQGLDTLEGLQLDVAWLDELCPMNIFKNILGRVARANRFGLVLNTFTPLQGYTAVVADYREAATCVLDTTGWMLPLDAGGFLDRARALEAEDILARAERPRTPKSPEAARYKTVPRVERCRDAGRAVMFFHTMDNAIVPSMEGYVQRYPRESLMRLYGVAEKSYSAMLPVDDAVHVIKDSAVPAAGTNICIVDPAPGRNMVMLWMRFHKNCVYIYREWPPRDRPVRGHGRIGAWAEPSGGEKKFDGVKGPGQTSLNWGWRRYKEEIAEVEGWEDFKREECGRPAVDAWRERHGAKEKIFRRIMDSRFASAKKQENDRSVTSITQFEEINLWFDTAPGTDIIDGVNTIIDLLHYDRERPVDATNQPRLFFAESCQNTIECAKMWTGEDGGEGASKDFIDLIRYGVTCGVGDVAGRDALRAKAPPPKGRHY